MAIKMHQIKSSFRSKFFPMNRPESVARLFLPWFVITLLTYAYLYVDNSVFISIEFTSFYYLGIILSIFLSPNMLEMKNPISLKGITKNLNLSASLSAFLGISIYAWIVSEMQYVEIAFRVSITFLQYILVYYIATCSLAVIERKNIVVASIFVIFLTSTSINIGGNYQFINIIGSFFYLPIQLFVKGKLFIALALFAIQFTFLFFMKQLAQSKVRDYIRARS